MAYSQSIHQRALTRLQQEKEQNELAERARIAAIYERAPRLAQIERELCKTSAHILAATFRAQGDPVAAMRQLKQDNLALQHERDWILQTEGLESQELDVQPICPHCGGTGYVGAAMCECLHELCRQEQKKELAPLIGSGNVSFEKARLDVYSDQYDPNCRCVPRKLMQQALRRAADYAQQFTPNAPSLLFQGATGLGKTFLSGCIARVVCDRGFSVCYAPVARLFAALEDDKFRPRPDGSRAEDFFSCDLLILDDLGTELVTQFTVSALYRLVNERLLDKKPVILSTNLTPDELGARYSPQIVSRILGSYTLYPFYGEDLRFKLK